MGRKHTGCSERAIEVSHQLKDLCSGGLVKVRRGFVGQDDGRSRHDRAGNGDSLALTTAQFHGFVGGVREEADTIQGFLSLSSALLGGQTMREKGEFDIFQRRQDRQQIERLKHESGVSGADISQDITGQVLEFHTIKPDSTARRLFDSTNQI